MRTKELNINKAMRTGVILAVIAIITFIAIVMTFAKYASQGTGEDIARVAKWGLNSNISTDLNLFDASYIGTGSKTIVDASDASNVIAPGTSKSDNVTLATFEGNQAPEVMYHFEPSVDIVDGYVQGSNSLTAQLDSLTGWHWTLGKNGESATEYDTVADFKAAVVALQEKDIDPNTLPSISTIQLGWKWDYEINNDANDTNLGNLIAQANLSGLKVTLNLNAYQCQGCGTGPSNPQSIVKTVDGQDVVFLPTYASGTPVFYTKDSTTNGYTKIEATDMASLASAIGSKENAKNVYVDADTASGQTFYGTIDKTWNDTFKLDTESGVSDGLNFTLPDGVSTVYFPVSGNWNRNEDSEPQLGTVGYNFFYSAYSSLLSSYDLIAPWSSRADSSVKAYYWDAFYSSWDTDYRDNDGTVVLSKAF